MEQKPEMGAAIGNNTCHISHDSTHQMNIVLHNTL